MPDWESVSATLTFRRTSSGESLRVILERSSRCDFDILSVGSLRDITRFAGAYCRFAWVHETPGLMSQGWPYKWEPPVREILAHRCGWSYSLYIWRILNVVFDLLQLEHEWLWVPLAENLLIKMNSSQTCELGCPQLGALDMRKDQAATSIAPQNSLDWRLLAIGVYSSGETLVHYVKVWSKGI